MVAFWGTRAKGASNISAGPRAVRVRQEHYFVCFILPQKVGPNNALHRRRHIGVGLRFALLQLNRRHHGWPDGSSVKLGGQGVFLAPSPSRNA